jgi:hypothetical protein
MIFGTKLIEVFQFHLDQNKRKEIYESALSEMDSMDVLSELEELMGQDEILDEAIRNIHPDIFPDEEVEDEEDFLEEDEF